MADILQLPARTSYGKPSRYIGGEHAKAEKLCVQVLKLRPGDPQALHLLGVLALQKGDAEKGVELIRRVLATQPGYAQAHGSLALGLEKLGQPDAAILSYDRLIAMLPRNAGALYNRGRLLNALARPAEALADFDRALEILPSAAALVDRGIALIALQRLSEALANFDQALVLNPDCAVAHYNRALALKLQDQLDAALAGFSQAISCRGDYVEAFVERANVLRALNRGEDSLADLDRALSLRPNFSQAHDSRGQTLVELKRLAEALASYDRAVALDSRYVHASFNKSLALLLMGRLSEGWELYACRESLVGWPQRHLYASPVWNGTQDLANRTLFVHWEQGLGDTIQFCRYAALAAARGAKVVFSVQDRLVRLLTDFAPGVQVIGEAAVPDHFDMHASLLSLPAAFATTMHTVPASIPYLAAEADRISHWRKRIGDRGFKIGVAWQGNRTRTAAPSRSFPLSSLQRIAAIPGARLISLQKDQQADRFAPNGMAIDSLGDDFDAGPDAFVDSAAVMMQCDLIITCDTSIAHLAGALARPVWVALKYVPEWRWQLDRADSPWYPTMRLFRQTEPGDWSGPFDAMEKALEAQSF